MTRSLNFILFVLLFATKAFSQTGEVVIDSSDFLSIDTSSVIFEDDVMLEYADEENSDTSHIEVINDSSVATFDSLFHGMDTTKMSPLVKSLIKDSMYWIAIDTNFAIFDSMSVNPYNFKGEHFKDTVQISLYQDDLGDSLKSWSMPLSRSEVNSHFGLRHYKWHYGTDLDIEMLDSVFTCFDGVIRISKFNPGGYGNYVIVRHHNGLETLYGHLTERLVKVGQHVKAGELIGLGGSTGRSTGPHLHFEVRYHGEAINPEDMYDFPNHTLKNPVLTISPEDFKYLKELKAARYHRIRSGDTLSGLAIKYRTSVRRICQLNGITPRTVLRLGKTLRVR